MVATENSGRFLDSAVEVAAGGDGVCGQSAPRRMWRRYVVGNVKFLRNVGRERRRGEWA